MALMISTLLATPVSSAYARRKHAPADNDICFNKALSHADKDECLSGFRAASTVAERQKLNKTYKQKIRVARQTPPVSK